MFLSAALMLRHGLGMEPQAAAIESAVDRALAEGLRTRDLGGTAKRARPPGSPHNTSKEQQTWNKRTSSGTTENSLPGRTRRFTY